MIRNQTQHTEITRDELNKALNDPNIMDKLVDQNANVIEMAFEMLSEGDHRACAFLCRAARKKTVRERLEYLRSSQSPEYVRLGLCSENPKMRKNTAKLIGVLGNNDDTESLITLLNEETMRMVIPSVILALGAMRDERARAALMAYVVRPAVDETEIKHEKEERDALKKALSAYASNEKHVFTGFGSIDAVLLICAVSMGRYVAEDCRREDIEVVSFGDSGVVVREANVEKLNRVRSFREILIPVCRRGSNYRDLRKRITQVLNSTHESNGEPFRYRIEYRGGGDRKNEIMRISELLECEELVNSVSDYEVEVRVYENGSVKLKLFTYEDARFAYRKAALPASITPSNAASVMSCVRKYSSEDAVVLDICCGSGTMLFERDKALPCRRIMGVDISEKAVEAAKENARLANPRALFYNIDCTRFTLREPVDEVISNLPFGNRVGTHEDNERLYALIFERMGEWLRRGGIAVFYTMEVKLLLREAERSGELELLDLIKTEAGGLMPTVAVFRRV